MHLNPKYSKTMESIKQYASAAYESVAELTNNYAGGMAAPKAPVVMTLMDWMKVLLGLGVSVSLVFGVLFWTTKKDKSLQTRLLTPVNFWFVLSGVIHIWIEGSFVFRREQSFLKPGLDFYASGDFRYGSPMEAGTAAMEAITAIFDGPMCFAIAYAATHQKSWRHPLQLVLCTCHIYGLVWFVLHPLFTKEGWHGHLSSDPFLFWFLVVGMNAPWALLPPYLFFQSWKALVFGEEAEEGVKKGGNVGRKKSAKAEPSMPAAPATPASEGRLRRRRL